MVQFFISEDKARLILELITWLNDHENNIMTIDIFDICNLLEYGIITGIIEVVTYEIKKEQYISFYFDLKFDSLNIQFSGIHDEISNKIDYYIVKNVLHH
jgi:hypothetical protein